MSHPVLSDGVVTKKTLSVVIKGVSVVGHEIRQLELARADGKTLPAFSPGAHVDMHLGPGLVRQYSLCGAASDTSKYLVAVKLEPASRGGSRAVHEQLSVGSPLEISAPRNNFPSAPDALHSILVAGGIGITPLLSMAYALEAQGRSFELRYFCRSPAHAAFLDTLRAGPFAHRCHFFFGLERDAVTVELERALAQPASGSHLYLCGPRPFMDLVQQVALASWPVEAIHLEYFAADAQATAPMGDCFDVKLARSGKTVTVEKEESIADALRRAGVDVETSCEQGVCGTCVTTVLQGVPEHHDCFLSPAEKAVGDRMAICVSRTRSPMLVLDL